MRRRTKAREIALQALYQLHMRGEEVWQHGLREFCKEAASGDSKIIGFAMGLIEGCWEHREKIDEAIVGVLEHWTLPRVAAIDRCVLRLGVYELLFACDVPPKVAINEAIDLAKRFSTEQSGVFVNGILDKIHTQHAAGEPPPDGAETER